MGFPLWNWILETVKYLFGILIYPLYAYLLYTEHQLGPAENYDVFLSHNWGANGVNHARVSRVNEALKLRGLKTWFDVDRLFGNMRHKIVGAISRSAIFLVFVTEEYSQKIETGDSRDYCVYEFDYVTNFKTRDTIEVVLTEARMRNKDHWGNRLKAEIGALLFTDLVEDNDPVIFERQCDRLARLLYQKLGREMPAFPLVPVPRESNNRIPPLLVPPVTSRTTSVSGNSDAPVISGNVVVRRAPEVPQLRTSSTRSESRATAGTVSEERVILPPIVQRQDSSGLPETLSRRNDDNVQNIPVIDLTGDDDEEHDDDNHDEDDDYDYEDSDGEDIDDVDIREVDQEVNVDIPANGENYVFSEDSSVGKLRISLIRVVKDNGLFYKYRLHVICGKGVYSFQDKTGDTYKLTVHRPGKHYVDFNSNQPKVVLVRRLQEK
jgi:hypothetical protein